MIQFMRTIVKKVRKIFEISLEDNSYKLVKKTQAKRKKVSRGVRMEGNNLCKRCIRIRQKCLVHKSM